MSSPEPALEFEEGFISQQHRGKYLTSEVSDSFEQSESHMFLTNLQAAREWFEILQTTGRSQTAVMNLAPGQASGHNSEAHPDSDQVLIVLDGEVLAEVADEQARMRTGDVVVIPAGVHHRFRNQSSTPARTVSVYAPPAYPAGIED